MVALITKCNGVASLLFHMEHFQGEYWRWRWRAAGGEWVEGRTDQSRVIFYPGSARAVDAQWRSTDGEEWCQAALHEIGDACADFEVTAREDLLCGEGFRLAAVLPCGLVASFVFGSLELAAGSSVILSGAADGCFPDNVLMAAGEFRFVDRRMAVENLGPSAGSFVVPPDPAARLSVIPGVAARRFFARAVDDAQWASLKNPPAL